MKNTTTQHQFLKDLTPGQLDTLQNKVLKHFRGRQMKTLHGNHMVRTHEQLENILGLPYTSGSDVAGLWVTNTEAYALNCTDWHYTGFGVLQDGRSVAILWDKDENEKLIDLSNRKEI